MLRVNIYLTEELNREIEQISRISAISKAEVVREALKKGLNKTSLKPNPNKALFEFIKLAESIPSEFGAPTDVSVNHDYYAWGGRKRIKK